MQGPPKQWHLYIVDLEPRVGSKPGKQRPCLNIQPSAFSAAGLPSSVILPLTTKLSKENTFPIRVSVPQGVCGLRTKSEVMIDQMLAWDHELFSEDLGEVPLELQSEVKLALREFLDL